MAKAYRATSFALIGSFVAVLAFPTRPAFADADYGAVVQALDDDHDRALEAARALQAGGEPAAEALRDGWDGLSVQAQRRAFDPLSSLAMDEDAAVDCLLAAARNGDSETQEAALLALRRAGPRGQAGIASLLGDPKVGERAATTLARTDADAAIGPLLGAIESEGGSDDPGLRTALGTAVDRATVDASTSVADWLRGGPSSAAAASAALGLAPVDAQQSSVTALVEYAIPNAQDDFATEWRLARGAAAAGPSETIDRWLINEMNSAEQWMLRSAAIEALAARDRSIDARAGLFDSYPRVRAEAAGVLAGDAPSMTDRATLARRDRWPFVRARAVYSLAGESDAMPVVVAAVNDPMSEVRVASIDVLTRTQGDEGWSQIQTRLADSNEWPSVTAAAIEYAQAHCRTDATPSLERVVRRAASPAAQIDDINNAAHAIMALRALGTPEADAAVSQLREADGVPPTLKMALEEPLENGARCVSPAR